MKYYFTSESITEGHPDKICDKISDAILDCSLEQDKNSKMAVETTIKDNLVLIYGEANTQAVIDYEGIARNVLKDIGYTEEFEIMTKISKQSSEINQAVCKDKICAGDQGIMFGYACKETEQLMPLAHSLASSLAYQLTKVRKEDKNSPLRPDGKTQVTVEYVDNKPTRIDTIIVASQHIEEISQEELKKYIIDYVINPIVPKNLIDENTKILINTSGSFVVGGPFGDSGTTGRKIVADTYGGYARIGGGCLSSKDPSKVDRSAAYYARYVAKNIVHYGLADKCEIQISYAIGQEQPISLYIDTFNTNKKSLTDIYQFVNTNFNFSVDNIIKELNLLQPIYYKTAAYGHFGRTDALFPWEQIKPIEFNK